MLNEGAQTLTFILCLTISLYWFWVNKCFLNLVILSILCLNNKNNIQDIYLKKLLCTFQAVVYYLWLEKSIWNLSRTDGIRIVLHLNKTIFEHWGENTRQISVFINRTGSHTPCSAQLTLLWLQKGSKILHLCMLSCQTLFRSLHVLMVSQNLHINGMWFAACCEFYTICQIFESVFF